MDGMDGKDGLLRTARMTPPFKPSPASLPRWESLSLSDLSLSLSAGMSCVAD